MSGRRSDIQIIGEILRLGETRKTKIMYRVNMSYAQLQRYLKLLLTRGLLETVGDEGATPRYRTTEKGRELLKSIDRAMEILKSKEI